MCLLSYFPDGIMPDPDALLNGTIFNDDGHGFAIVDRIGNRIIVDRGMDAKEMIEAFVVTRTVFPNGPALFHSRLATDGTTSLLNCHPFLVGGDPRTVLAHNGIMPARPKLGDPRSDTRLMAEDRIPRAFGKLRTRRSRQAFERWMTSANKVVILTIDPRFRGNAFILNERAGMWDGGVWYSNDMYQPWTYGASTYKYSHAAEDGMMVYDVIRDSDHRSTGPSLSRRLGRCWACQTEVDYRLGECPTCGFCFDCNEMPDRCMCYVPTRRLDSDVAVTS